MARTPLKKTAEIIKRQARGVPAAGGGVAFGQSFFKKKPEHVRLVGECLMTWPIAETYMAVLLAALMRTDNNTTIAVYQTLRRSTAKYDAIEQAAKYALDLTGQELIKCLRMVSESLESERNALAHAFWGINFE